MGNFKTTFSGKHYNVQKELHTMQNALDEAKKNKTTVKDLFVNSYLLKPLLISVALMFFQQASGINAVLFNMASIFKVSNISNMLRRYYECLGIF